MHLTRLVMTAGAAGSLLFATGASADASVDDDATVVVSTSLATQGAGNLYGGTGNWYFTSTVCAVAGPAAAGICTTHMDGTFVFSACDTGTMLIQGGVVWGPNSQSVVSNAHGTVSLAGGSGALSASGTGADGAPVRVTGTVTLDGANSCGGGQDMSVSLNVTG